MGTLALTIMAAPRTKNNILTIKETITDNDIVFPESFETDTRELMKNWYLQNYTVLDADVENKATGEVSDEEWLSVLKGPAYGRQAPARKIAWRAKYMCKSFVAQYLGSDYMTAEKVFCLSGGKEIKDLKFTNISKNSDVCDEQTGKIAVVIRKAIRFVD